MDVIKTADHVIDLGPEGGHAGGEVVATGTPEEIGRMQGVAHRPIPEEPPSRLETSMASISFSLLIRRRAHVPGAVPVSLAADVRAQHRGDESSGVVRQLYGWGAPVYEKERELTYDGVFPDRRGAARRSRSRSCRRSELDGAHGVTRRKDGAIVITRNDLLTPTAADLHAGTRALTIERLPHRTNVMLERFHRRRGYATGYALDTAWAVTGRSRHRRRWCSGSCRACGCGGR